ncbi:lipopolysaccharide transport periplasmic protein LptA [Oryzomonas sagensis]|uniref:Lipopolysaccharide transport periplasmic protein LptA n=1 Tax=Oryzomonas sagensis TaxID=2603857 RepID=A0ABQ6TMB6_9BACT|nr:lipopolysaccharide transport periplasmic protein LptA [Oryzomonas sagensis]KAB0669523.1 lipopolysaccharide transport periplasmic protein LptA [Oryzomonas sagensis]
MNKMKIKPLLFIIVVSMMLPLATVFAAAHKDRSSLPIAIKANELAADNKGKTAIFSGKVVAKQGDITIYADRLIINYGDKKNDVEKIEANGNVRIVQENRIGTATHAVYESKLGRITLTGNPKIMQGADTMSGNIITYFIDEDRSEVSSGAGRPVEVVIHPTAKKGNAGTR